MIDEGYTKDDTEDELLKNLIEQLSYKGVKHPSYLIEQVNIRKEYIFSYNPIKEANKSSLAFFSVNIM